jgi:hypothetical protein
LIEFVTGTESQCRPKEELLSDVQVECPGNVPPTRKGILLLFRGKSLTCHVTRIEKRFDVLKGGAYAPSNFEAEVDSSFVEGNLLAGLRSTLIARALV